MVFLLALLLGLVVGSFLNVLIYRLNTPRSPSPLWGRSFCPKCKHKLSWTELVPLVSFVKLGGRCRYCHKEIGWQYPVVEAVTAISFVLLVLLGKFDLGMTIIFCCLVVIFFSDLVYGLIPDEMVGILGILGLLGGLGNIIWGIGAAGVFYLIYFLTKRRGMGLGDVKLAGAMGLLLGWPRILIAFYWAFILGGAVAGVLLLLKRKRFGETIALGPFLCIGVILSLSWSW